MSTHKHLDRLCTAVLAFCLLLTIAFMNGERLGLRSAASVMGYETRLFDTERVHTIDIIMDDWDGFIETCENEEYVSCAVVIDGEACKNTGIRAKGNTSLTMVSSMDSDRYSFKLEFDHYESGRTYHGLDKLSLNNLIQDSTCMKDYLTYRMMSAFGVDAPLCSYVYITVNGQDWGLYLAVEGVEDAFLQRNYGSSPGELYKPDSTGLGGGRGNGRAFNLEDVMDDNEDGTEGGTQSRFPDGGKFPEEFAAFLENGPVPPDGRSGFRGARENGGPGGFGGMGSDDVKLKYIDEDPDSYSNIFQNAKTDVTGADQARLIAALKALGNGEDLENTVNIDEVIRYFVVHNFVCNGDSYTGSMVHNYYLYEEDGQLSMIPWDYNLAYGTFQGGSASSAVNAPIDTPVSGGDSRPMLDWIFSSAEYTALYHQYFQEFLETVNCGELIQHAAELIAPFVEKDPTAFCTYEEFQTGTEALCTFCRLRTESVWGQLDGSIPSTSEEQAKDSASLIDVSGLSLSDMGTMIRGGFGARDFNGGNGFQGPGWTNEDRASPLDFEREPSSEQSPEESFFERFPEPPAEPGADFSGAPSRQRERPEKDIFPEESALPEGNGFPGFPGEAAPVVSGTTLLLAAVSVVILFAGLLFVLLYKRR